MSTTISGARLRRREDPRQIQGQGRYVEDLAPAGLLHAAFVRCPNGHARVTKLGLDMARAMPGVRAVFGPADLPSLDRPLPVLMQQPGVEARMPAPLARTVRFAGEAVAYDAAGRLLTPTWAEYLMPTAGPVVSLVHDREPRHRLSVSNVEVEHLESPSPFNPERIKGAGEGGTIGALATLVGAIEDALAPFGVKLNELPVRPERLAVVRAGSGRPSSNGLR